MYFTRTNVYRNSCRLNDAVSACNIVENDLLFFSLPFLRESRSISLRSQSGRIAAGKPHKEVSICSVQVGENLYWPWTASKVATNKEGLQGGFLDRERVIWFSSAVVLARNVDLLATWNIHRYTIFINISIIVSPLVNVRTLLRYLILPLIFANKKHMLRSKKLFNVK